MKQILKLFLLVSIFASLLCGCVYQRGIILFNKQPITKENALCDDINFTKGERVYYLFVAAKRMDCDYIRIQVFKMTDKASTGGYEVVRTKDVRLMREERYYYTDYFTFYESGRYVMQVFSMNDMQHPLSLDFFYIK